MRGFTLIEVVTVLFLCTMIALIIFNSITLSNRVYEQKEELTEVLQNGRVILDSMSREIRQSRRIITDLPENMVGGEKAIVFQDGHLSFLSERGTVYEGEGRELLLEEDASDVDGIYEGVYIKIFDPLNPSRGEVGKVTGYDGEERKVFLENSLDKFDSYGGLEYVIDTDYYYISYFLDEEGRIMREVFSYYFSGDENLYVPHNSTPPQGETLEKEILEKPRVVGEHIEKISFWENEEVGVYLEIKKGERGVNLLNTISPRNI